MKILEINFDAVQKAMEDIRRDRVDYYLDSETGGIIAFCEKISDDILRELYTSPDDDPDEDVIFDSNVNISAEIPDSVLDEFENALSVTLDPERFIRIPERDRMEAYSCMERFAAHVADPALKKSLMGALSGERAFRSFKDALLQVPRIRKQWNSFNAGQMRSVIKTWLGGMGIKAVRRRGSPDPDSGDL